METNTPEERVEEHLTDAIRSLIAAEHLLDELTPDVIRRISDAVDDLIMDVGVIRRSIRE